MSDHVVPGRLKTRILTATLVVSLVGGILGMGVVGSRLSNETGRIDRSAPAQTPTSPHAQLRAASGVS